MWLISACYLLLAVVAAMLLALQVSNANPHTGSFGRQPDFGETLRQGETIMPNGDKYVRNGNLVTIVPADGGERLGWYVGDDPRALGGRTIGTGPGRIPLELFLGLATAIVCLAVIGVCSLIRHAWAWRVVYCGQWAVVAIGVVWSVGWSLFLVSALRSGLAVEIALVQLPITVGVPLFIAQAAWWATRYLNRPYVQAAMGVRTNEE